MKLRLIPILCFLFVLPFCGFAADKVAVVGIGGDNARTAELLTAELGGKYELVERQ